MVTPVDPQPWMADDAVATPDTTASGLPATGFGILGLLARGPCTQADVVQQFRTTYGHFWNRTDALIYEQTRRLLVLGLAARHADAPQRPIRITDHGRAALGTWLNKPSAPPRLDIEAAMRLRNLDAVDGPDARRGIAELGAWAEDRRRAVRDAAPPSNPADALIAELLDDVYAAVRRWADRHGAVPPDEGTSP